MDYFEYNEHEVDLLVYAFTAIVAAEQRRMRRRQRINVAILVLSLAGVCAIAWWLR